MKKKINAKDEIESSSAPLIEHLSELRSRLIWCLLTFVICMILVFPFSDHIFNFLAKPIVQLLSNQGRPAELIFTGMQQGFMVNIKISFWWFYSFVSLDRVSAVEICCPRVV
jgi:sec-independent protein translocase protein TatC